MRVRSAVIALIVTAAVVAAPSAAVAAERSRAATGTYDMDFTLPTLGKSGCTVCHEDKNLVRIVDGETRSLFVDTQSIKESVHAKLACTQCHTDFAYKTPHKNTKSGDWIEVANLSCRNTGCHPEEYAQMNSGAHSLAGTKGTKVYAASSGSSTTKNPPTCGGCHGGHDIAKLTGNPSAQRAIRARGAEMCGECHESETQTYSDYYHGAAYKKGAPDAPACWQCHGAHEVQPSDNRLSPTAPDNLTATCGGSMAKGAHCHTGVNAQFVSYSSMIHGRDQVRADNPAWGVYEDVKQTIEGAVTTVRSWFS